MGHKKPVRIDPMSMKLLPGGVDSHAHLDSREFDADRQEVLERARAAGVSRIGNVFLGPADFRARREMFSNAPEVFFLLGIHPCDGMSCTEECIEEMEAIFRQEPRILAVGEIGLDYHWDDCPRELQLQAFARQMELARRLGLPAVIHCREAEDDCLTFLEAGGFAGYPLLWHCFGGDAALARRIVRNGWHLSIPGTVTYPANRALREAAAVVPADRLLVETDAPYLSPVPWRGTRNESAYIVFTARAVAEARHEDPETLWRRCGENAVRFFGIPEPTGR